MKRLLRGVIDFGALSQESLLQNFERLCHADVEWVQPADEKIFRFVKDFFESQQDLPSAKVMADLYTRADDHECVERLKDIKSAPSYDGANYRFVLKEELENQARGRLDRLIKTAHEINNKGVVVGEGRSREKLTGPLDALRYLQSADGILRERRPDVLRTELRDTALNAKLEYVEGKGKPQWGLITGIEQLDKATHGLKPGQIWVHCASTGEMKSAFAQNWAYNAMTRYRRHVVYVSLEMTQEEFRRAIYTMHSAHPRFEGRQPLRRSDIEDRTLTEEQEAFYFDVLQDFRDNDDYARFELLSPGSERMTVKKLEQKLREIDREIEIGMVIIDHAELVEPRRKTGNRGVDINEVYQDLERLAVTWKDGQGLPLLVTHQVNRQGKVKAEKEGGRYLTTECISWSADAGTVASYVTWSYLDHDLRENGKVRFGTVKTRQRGQFEPFEASVDWDTLRITSRSKETDEAHDAMTEEAFDDLSADV